MNQIKGLSRHQVTFGSLEDYISAYNPVRVLDAFVDKLDLNQFTFSLAPSSEESLKTSKRR
jgi:hypothetical protein